MMTDDQTFLRQFASDGSREALDALIRKHLNLVYSAALRQVRDPHLAEDVTQAVFLILAKKAATIRSGVAVGGWLLAVTRRASVDAMRRRAIDRRHEQAIARPELTEAAEPQWEHVAPELDEAMSRLSDADRDAVVLRFFQNYSLAQVGIEMGITEEAARKRVGRALQRLRNLLTGSAATVSAAALGTAITSHAVQAAPAQLLPAMLAGGASTSVAAIAKGAMNMMAWAKAKFAAAMVLAIVLVLGGGTLLMTRSNAQSPPQASAISALPTPPVLLDQAALVTANNRFAIDLLREFNPQPNENAFYSPYSVSTALAMTWAGARGDTAGEIAKALHFSELAPANVTSGFNSIQQSMAQVQKRTGAQLSIANSLWPEERPEAPFNAAYLNHVQSDFGAALFPTDFKRNFEPARAQINQWVEDKTQQKIKDLLQSGDVSSSTRFVLVNAIYFKAKWATEFSPASSSDAQFHMADGSTKPVVMMRNTFNTHYADIVVDSKPVQVLKLNYKNNSGNNASNDGLSMLFVLPQAVDGLPAVIKALSAETLSSWVDKLADVRVNLSIPKFTFKERYSLIEPLQSMGMKSAFIDPVQDPSYGADFTGMVNARYLYINKAIHQTFVSVDEQGTEAAAATATAFLGGAAPRPPDVTFRADHPFLFLIRDDTSGSVLFMGQMANPPAPEKSAVAQRQELNAQMPGAITSPLGIPPIFTVSRGRSTTTSSRLTNARNGLNKAIEYLNMAPDALHDGHTSKALASANQALAEISKAAEYVREHPESDPLQTGTSTGAITMDAVPVPMNPRLPANFGPQSTIMAGTRGGPTTRLGPPDANGMMIGADKKVLSVNIYMAINYLNLAHQALSNPGGRGTYSGPVIGDIGGHRDEIKADIKKAAEEALAGYTYVHDHADASSVKSTAPISGQR